MQLSIKGIAAVLTALKDRLLFSAEEQEKRRATALKDLGVAAEHLAQARATDVQTFKEAVELLRECGVPKEVVQEMVVRRIADLRPLMEDIEALQRYVRKGTIVEVRVIEPEKLRLVEPKKLEPPS
jgi:hypothetical protein